MKERCAVPVQQLRRHWDPDQLGLVTTEETPVLDGLVGQERAVSALHFGLSLRNPGYNIYVSGPSGTGKTSYSCSLVRSHAESEPVPPDWVYVHNFDRPDEPVALALAPGGGPAFAHDMEELVLDARTAAGRALDAKEHQARREDAVRRARIQIAQIMEELEGLAQQSGFGLTQTDKGLMPVPMLDGQPLSEEQFGALPVDSKREISERGQTVRQSIADAARRTWELEKALREELRHLDSDVATQAQAPVVTHLKEKYKHYPRVVAWLDRAEREIVGHTLPPGGPSQAMAEAAATSEGGPAPSVPARPDLEGKFRVNVFVHRQRKSGAPVVVENNPSYFNLFGKVELTPTPDGAPRSSVINLKAGSLHRANGGYLVLQAADMLRNLGAWETLKRSLSTREARVEVPEAENRMFPVEIVRPQPIPLDVKVILIGSSHLYRALYGQDEEFRKRFKIKAEFDIVMDASPTNVEGYARFVSQVCRHDRLKHLTADALAHLIEHSHRLAEDQTKLSARFNEVVEVIYEANAWASQAGSQVVDAAHVEQAIQEKASRAALPELHLQEMIQRGTIMVDVDGAVVGQVNGLTVMNTGDHSFGSPSRITARVYTGQKGILHIEREIDMTGQIHDKGLFTLSGYLGDRFAQDKPLAFSASIAFEQTYVPVDGDSASSTELYALLSALADAPIDQGIAVTGSVNQRGQVQPIGGVNEKVEGFFRVCKIRGLTGRQGVMIPRQNLPNLMLSAEVVAAVRGGQFNVWAVSSIEEGIEILTGIAAGQRGPDGRYPAATVFERVDRRIETLVRNLSLWQ